MTGTVGILNVGAGDIKLSFDPSNPAERIRAARIVKDMLRRGYAILVEVTRKGKTAYQRAYDFDETKCEYIIADLDPVEAGKADQAEAENEQFDKASPAPKQKKAVGRPRKLKAESTKAIAVSRTSGG